MSVEINTSWQEMKHSLVRNFEFADFKQAIIFINKVAEIANDSDHHPKIENMYNLVTLTLSTYDAGDIVT